MSAHVAVLKGAGLFDRLKLETRSEHLAVEQELDILRRDLNLEAYIAILARFYGFYKPLEERLLPGLPSYLSDFPSRRFKTGKLSTDLLQLGVAPQSLAMCQSLPDVSTGSHVIGCLYVLEGATLGGQLIARHVKATLGLKSDSGCSFFSSYGSEVGHMWRSFRQVAEANVPPEAHHEVVNASRQTFAAFRAWLQGAADA